MNTTFLQILKFLILPPLMFKLQNLFKTIMIFYLIIFCLLFELKKRKFIFSPPISKNNNFITTSTPLNIVAIFLLKSFQNDSFESWVNRFKTFSMHGSTLHSTLGSGWYGSRSFIVAVSITQECAYGVS